MAVKLSIVIPVYRVEATLERCLKSIVGQTFRNFEVILVDDGSPDRCPQMCDEWALSDNRIRVIHKENGGLSDARNAGIEQATGEHITFVDSDDFLAADTYEQAMALAERADIVEFPIYRFYGSKRQAVVCFPEYTYHDMGEYWLKGKAYEHTYAVNKIYRRRLFSEVRFPVGRVFEDVYTLPQLLRRAESVMTTGKGMYYYCANEQGITATAKGSELNMLLESHLVAMRLWVDDAYYMEVLNKQIDVCELTGRAPAIPPRKVSPLAKGLSPTARMKAAALRLLGIKGICRLNRIIHKATGRCS